MMRRQFSHGSWLGNILLSQNVLGKHWMACTAFSVQPLYGQHIFYHWTSQGCIFEHPKTSECFFLYSDVLDLRVKFKYLHISKFLKRFILWKNTSTRKGSTVIIMPIFSLKKVSIYSLKTLKQTIKVLTINKTLLWWYEPITVGNNINPMYKSN